MSHKKIKQRIETEITKIILLDRGKLFLKEDMKKTVEEIIKLIKQAGFRQVKENKL